MDQPGLNPEHISVFKDLTSGTIGGMCGLLIGQPLDRVKVLSQTAAMRHPIPSSSSLSSALEPAAPRPGTMATLVLLTRREGFLSLWKGVGGPMIGAAPLNALAFAGNGKTLRYLDSAFPSSTASSRPYSHYLIAGCVGGFTQTIAAVPAELIKVRLQVLQGEKGAKAGAKGAGGSPTNALAMIRHVWATEGLRGFFRGFAVTCVRDVPSYGVYFLVYEMAKDALLALPARSPSLSASPSASEQWASSAAVSSVESHPPSPLLFPSPVLPMLISGALAGASSWLSCYPIDVIKSIIQTGHGGVGGASSRMLTVSRDLYARGGWRAFFRGLSPTLVRSVPVNAVTFTVYEHCQLLWETLWPTYHRGDA